MSALELFSLDGPDEFTVDDLGDLMRIRYSPEQLAAITAPLEPFVVVAGAGSGKTSVMTARVVWLVATGQVLPEQVLGLTFTNKAAGELSTRVRRAVQLLSDRVAGVPHDEVGEPTVSTYHAFAGRLLAEHGLRMGVEPSSRLLTEAASVQLAHRVVTRTTLDLSDVANAVSTIVEYLRALDSELAEHCLEPDALHAFDASQVAQIDALDKQAADTVTMRRVSLTRMALAQLAEEFRAARHARDLIDFSDQMRFGAGLAERFPEVGASLRAQFPVVLLDEYQDTSVAQRRMLTALFGGGHPVTAVGDPLQAIYGWRGASVANIDGFPRHFPRADGSPARVLRLSENRRSGVHILDAANELAAPLRSVHPQVAPLVAPGAHGTGAAKPSGGLRVSLHQTYAEEIGWIADRVVEQIASGVPADDIAILCRAKSDFGALMAALSGRRVPVDVLGLDGMLAMPEVAEVVSILEVLHDSAANPALVRLLSGPRWRIGLRDLALLGERAATLAGSGRRSHTTDVEEQLDAAVTGIDPADVVSLLDALDDPGSLDYDAEARGRFAALSAEIRRLRRGVGDPLPDLVHRVITATGLDVEMAASPDMLRLHRSEGLASFVELVAGFADAEGDAGIGAFLVWLRLASRFDKVPELDRPSTPGSVQLMTVHRSKGLEWPVVVIPSLTATVFPDSKGMTRWTSQSKAVPFPERGDADSLPQLRGFTAKDHKAFADACRDHSTLDETRLAYVAVTRAERLVIASSSWWGPSQARKRGPSPFLQTLREQCLVGAGTVDVWTAPPDDDAVNPSLGDTVDLPWPPARDSGALERLRTAATGVLDHAGLTVDDLRAEHARPAADSAAGAEGSPLLGLDAEDLELVRGWDDDIALLLEERRAERSATRTVPLPASLSASDLVRLAADPDTFTRRLARPVPSAPAPSARRGTRFHAWVEAHFGVQPLLEPDDLPGSSDPDIGSDEAFEAMQQRFLALPYADRTPLGIEVAFSLVIAGRVVPGRIDAVFAETRPDGSTHYEVLDWKTSRRHDADPLQLAIYRVAFAEQTGVPLEDVTAAFVYLHDGVVVPYADLPDRAGLEALLLGARGPGTGVADREPVAGPEASAATTH